MSDARSFSHLLVLVDGTEAASRAVDLAIGLALTLESRLTFMAVVETETLHRLLGIRILSSVEMTEFEDELNQNAATHLAEARERARRRGVDAGEIVAAGNSETVLPAEVRKRGVDLVVVGAFQSSHAIRDVVARQRQQAVDHAPCHVLVVK